MRRHFGAAGEEQNAALALTAGIRVNLWENHTTPRRSMVEQMGRFRIGKEQQCSGTDLC